MDQSIGNIVKNHLKQKNDFRVLDIEDVKDCDITKDDTLGIELSILMQTREIFQKIREAVEEMRVQ